MKTFEELQAIAEKAEQAPFLDTLVFDTSTRKWTIPDLTREYADFVVAAHPAMVLALLAEIDRLKAERP